MNFKRCCRLPALSETDKIHDFIQFNFFGAVQIFNGIYKLLYWILRISQIKKRS